MYLSDDVRPEHLARRYRCLERPPAALPKRLHPEGATHQGQMGERFNLSTKLRTEPLNLQLNPQQRGATSRGRSPGIGLWRG
jgi:hypothetical protein